MTSEEYNLELKRRIDSFFRRHPEIPDHRQRHPWITGFCGNPFSGIWFVGENPSLGTADREVGKLAGPPTEESQWRISRGDDLFRRMLVKHGFKQPPPDAAGGWNCYITDIIKQAADVSKWRKKGSGELNRLAVVWSEVFSWELEIAKPKLMVAMGRKVEELLGHLKDAKGLPLPTIRYMSHYSYIAMRPCGKLPAMHPERVAAYDKQMEQVAAEFVSLYRA